jgi:hypothetical protein
MIFFKGQVATTITSNYNSKDTLVATTLRRHNTTPELQLRR